MGQHENIVCPLCGDQVDKLVYRYHIDNEKVVLEKIKEHNPSWTVNDGACSRCLDYYHTEVVMQQRMLPEVGPYFPVKSADDFIILPTPLRLDADARFTGKGVTICFIDSGFYPHPDLTSHKNRIKTIVDITAPSKSPPKGETCGTLQSLWHGTMTSVACAGDGYLSNGLYKGIASDAELVLLKVMNDEGHITTENIVKALRWVLNNYKRYDIRIVNMSLGDDTPISYKQSEIDKLAEQLVELGIIVVAAVGNDENGAIKPPANSPHVIAVGGIDDENNLYDSLHLYHSAYGKTVDELMKPELVANAIWIAAPILPGTKEQREAEALYSLINMNDDELVNVAVAWRSQMKTEEDPFRNVAETGHFQITKEDRGLVDVGETGHFQITKEDRGLVDVGETGHFRITKEDRGLVDVGETGHALSLQTNGPRIFLANATMKFIHDVQLDASVFQSNDVTFIREAIVRRIQACKYISLHYMHVDGTSFAAPIVCSLIAQMMEARPELTVEAIREVLFSTAKRIDGWPPERQGFGVIRPRKALLKVLKRELIMKANASPFINQTKNSIEFYIQSDCASQISLAGNFNGWANDVLLLEPGRNGLWKIEIPMLPAGRYKYKFFIDDKMWMEDVENPYREPDGFSGFNSLLIVKS